MMDASELWDLFCKGHPVDLEWEIKSWEHLDTSARVAWGGEGEGERVA